MTITPLKIKLGPSSLLTSRFSGKTEIGPDYCFCLLNTIFHHLKTVMSRIRWILESVNNVKWNKITVRTLRKGRNETEFFFQFLFISDFPLNGCTRCLAVPIVFTTGVISAVLKNINWQPGEIWVLWSQHFLNCRGILTKKKKILICKYEITIC